MFPIGNFLFDFVSNRRYKQLPRLENMAAIAARRGIQPRDVDVREIQTALRTAGFEP